MNRVLLALCLTVLLAPWARAQAKPDPAAIGSYDEMAAQIRAEAAGARAAEEQVDRTWAELTRAIAALRAQGAVVEPLLQRRAALQGQVLQLSNYDYIQGLTVQLPPVIASEERRLRERETVADATQARRPDDAEARRLLDFLRQKLAGAQRDLTVMRPAFMPAGATVADSLAAVQRQQTALEEQARPAEVLLTSRATELNAAVTRAVALQQALIDAPVRYYALRFEAQRRFAPPYLAEIQLRAPYDRDGIYYHAVIEETESDNADARTARTMLEQLPGLEQQTAGYRNALLKAEREFRQVADEWQARNADYMLLMNQEYFLNIVLELVDATAGIAADGGNPAAFVFEAGWRVTEAVRGDFRIKDPTLSEELTAYRERIIAELGPAGAGGTLIARPRENTLAAAEELQRKLEQQRLPRAAEAGDITLDALKDVGKGFAAEGFGKLCASCAAGGTLNARLAQVLALWNPALTPEMYAAIANGPLRSTAEAAAERIARGVGTETDKLLVKNVEREAFGKKFGIGLGVGVAVGIGKNLVKDGLGLTQQRAHEMTEMAVLDIKWFIQRAAYVAAAEADRRARRQLIDYQAEIGKLYARQLTRPNRTLRVLANRPFASVGETIEAQLRFSQPVTDVSVRVGASGSYTSSLDQDRSTRFTIPLYGSLLAAGTEPVEVQARAPVVGAPFDANPLTVPPYTGPTLAAPSATPSLWGEVERGLDTSHRIAVEAPTFTLADPANGRPYIAGDWVGVAYHLPGSLRFQSLRLQFDDGETLLPFDNLADGRVQLQLRETAESGKIRLMRLNAKPSEPLEIAAVPLTVARAARKSLPGGPGRLSQVDLPTRGLWFQPSLRPLLPTEGRILFERRDAANQLTSQVSYTTRVDRPDGTRPTWDASLDVPPGVYDVKIFAYPEQDFPGQQVKAGRTIRLATRPLGRINLVGQHGTVWLLPPGKDTPRFQTSDSSLDVEPGLYDVAIYVASGQIRQNGVPIAAGKATVLELPAAR